MRYAILPVLLLLSGCDIEDFHGIGQYTRDFHFSYPFRSGGRLNIESFNGSIEISPWDQNTIDISGTKYARSQQEADDLKIDIVQNSDSVSIRVARPYDRRGSYGARFVIKAPRGVVLDRITTSNGGIQTADAVGPARLKTSNGPIRVNSLRGNVDAQTSNGPIELTNIEGDILAHTSNSRIRVELAGPALGVRADTSNGPIDLVLPEGIQQSLRAETSNSAITVRLPQAAGAHVVAHTSNSSISTDFQVGVRGEIAKHQMDAVIGGGGPMIELTTSNGPIRLLKM